MKFSTNLEQIMKLRKRLYMISRMQSEQQRHTQDKICRIEKNCFQPPRKILWNMHVNTDIRTRVLMQVSSLLYGVQAWTLTKATYDTEGSFRNVRSLHTDKFIHPPYQKHGHQEYQAAGGNDNRAFIQSRCQQSHVNQRDYQHSQKIGTNRRT